MCAVPDGVVLAVAVGSGGAPAVRDGYHAVIAAVNDENGSLIAHMLVEVIVPYVRRIAGADRQPAEEVVALGYLVEGVAGSVHVVKDGKQ